MSLGIYRQKIFVSVYQGITIGNDGMKKKWHVIITKELNPSLIFIDESVKIF